MAPSAAALTGFEGTSPTSHSRAVGAARCDGPAPAATTRSDAVVAASIGSHASSGGVISAVSAALQETRRRKSAAALRPSRPTRRGSLAEATPTTRLETTSGTTVIRIALTQSVPTGSASAARASSAGLRAA